MQHSRADCLGEDRCHCQNLTLMNASSLNDLHSLNLDDFAVLCPAEQLVALPGHDTDTCRSH